MVISKQVLVMLAWLQAAATDGSTSSEQSCEGDDGSAYLQHFAKESSAYLALLSGNRSDPCITDINTGLCGNGQCTGCTPSGPSTPTIIPTTGTGFADEELECIGTLTTCKATGGSTTPLAGGYYEFLNPIDQLVCKAQDTGGTVGSQVCYDKWNIDNVAAVCCSAGGLSDQVCYNSWFLLSTVDTRVHDVCCDGLQTCYQVTFQNVNSLSCRGNNVCQNSIGETDISSNLYCDGESIANTKSVDPMDACYQFPITFGKNAASSHCITCKRDEVCRDSDWTFPNGGNVNMLCTDLPASGKKNCRNLNLIFEANGCVELNCEGSTSVPGTLPCNLLAVLKSDTTNPTVSCKCTGICDGLATTTDKEGYSIVTCNSEKTCGVTCGTDDTACCKAEAGVNGGHPRCGTGFCTTSTTTPQQDPTTGTTTSTAIITGDPHIDTFDGQHYLLLKQGSFSFWRFAGSDAEIVSAKNQALLKKLPVDFKFYAHYSGHTSYTKGLLLVDSSGATTPKRVLELTSEDCTWRTKTKDTEWSAVEKPQLLSLPDADGDEMTAFRMTEPLHGQKMYVELLMKKTDGFKKIGNLYVRCKPGYHINMKIAMTSKEDIGLVQGQVGAQGHTAAGEDHKASFLQGTRRVRSDSEFVTSKKWTDLGGSAAAETYLSEVDEEGPAAFLKDCTGQERIKAKAMCKKYLGEPPTRSEDLHSFENRFDSCIFDACNGGGEVAAELAAEIFHAE